jgi:hypothetical protein
MRPRRGRLVAQQDGGDVVGAAGLVGAVDEAVDSASSGSSLSWELAGDVHVVDDAGQSVRAQQQPSSGCSSRVIESTSTSGRRRSRG